MGPHRVLEAVERTLMTSLAVKADQMDFLSSIALRLEPRCLFGKSIAEPVGVIVLVAERKALRDRSLHSSARRERRKSVKKRRPVWMTT